MKFNEADRKCWERIQQDSLNRGGGDRDGGSGGGGWGRGVPGRNG